MGTLIEDLTALADELSKDESMRLAPGWMVRDAIVAKLRTVLAGAGAADTQPEAAGDPFGVQLRASLGRVLPTAGDKVDTAPESARIDPEGFWGVDRGGAVEMYPDEDSARTAAQQRGGKLMNFKDSDKGWEEVPLQPIAYDENVALFVGDSEMHQVFPPNDGGPQGEAAEFGGSVPLSTTDTHDVKQVSKYITQVHTTSVKFNVKHDLNDPNVIVMVYLPNGMEYPMDQYAIGKDSVNELSITFITPAPPYTTVAVFA